MRLDRTAPGFPVRLETAALDEGYDVAIFGGTRTHAGAATPAAAVCVRSGIPLCQCNAAQITAVMTACEALPEDVLRQ